MKPRNKLIIDKLLHDPADSKTCIWTKVDLTGRKNIFIYECKVCHRRTANGSDMEWRLKLYENAWRMDWIENKK